MLNIRTKRGAETVGFGKLAEEVVQEKLWRFGYAVERQKHNFSFDLLVDEKFKVEVKASKLKYKSNGEIWWNVLLGGMNYDVLAVVLQMPLTEPLILFFSIEEVKKFKGEKISQIFSQNNRELLENRSPYKVFGKPKSQRSQPDYLKNNN